MKDANFFDFDDRLKESVELNLEIMILLDKYNKIESSSAYDDIEKMDLLIDLKEKMDTFLNLRPTFFSKNKDYQNLIIDCIYYHEDAIDAIEKMQNRIIERGLCT